MGSAPLQPPLAVQLVALVLLQVSVELPFTAIVVGLADRLTVGVPAGLTVTIELAAALPPVPVQVSV